MMSKKTSLKTTHSTLKAFLLSALLSFLHRKIHCSMETKSRCIPISGFRSHRKLQLKRSCALLLCLTISAQAAQLHMSTLKSHFLRRKLHGTHSTKSLLQASSTSRSTRRFLPEKTIMQWHLAQRPAQYVASLLQTIGRELLASIVLSTHSLHRERLSMALANGGTTLTH